MVEELADVEEYARPTGNLAGTGHVKHGKRAVQKLGSRICIVSVGASERNVVASTFVSQV